MQRQNVATTLKMSEVQATGPIGQTMHILYTFLIDCLVFDLQLLKVDEVEPADGGESDIERNMPVQCNVPNTGRPVLFGYTYVRRNIPAVVTW